MPGAIPHARLITPLTPARSLQVLTVEPGLYLPAEDDELPRWYRGVGVRIEDDVLLLEGGGAEVLTAAAPKAPEEVEAALAAADTHE